MDLPIADIFEFCPRCGSKSESLGSNPFCCTGCDYSHFFSPFTAVGSIIADKDGRVLLITRARDPGKGKFGLPGGFVDAGESLEEALKREVLEEVNLHATSITYLASFPNSYAYKGVVSAVTDAFFVCRVNSFDSLVVQAGEVSDYHFVHPTKKELDNLAFESNRRALEFYLSQNAK